MKQGLIPQTYVPEGLKTRFLRACGKQGRSMTDVVRQLITEFVEREEQKR